MVKVKLKLKHFSSSYDHDSISESSVSMPSGSNEISPITEEEEYMAKCLMLLADSAFPNKNRDRLEACHIDEEFLPVTTSTNALLHECKTCFKTFPSFQALGGHRASHKRPKSIEEADRNLDQDQEFKKSKAKIRIHECLICGSGFYSGQALGGHMRRHQHARMSRSSVKKKQKRLMAMDLNSPVPPEEDTGG